jgi:hypothetical protein
MKRSLLLLSVLACGLGVRVPPFPAAETTVLASVQTDGRTERVKFVAGKSSKTIKGSIKGRRYVDYLISAAAGQTITVTLKGSNPQNYFNLNPPGSEFSMFVGSTSGRAVQRMLPADGDYTIRVYLMRAAARRNESSTYTLTVAVAGKPLAAIPPSVDAVIPGTPYHAKGPVACKYYLKPELTECEAFVIRRGNGTATVELRLEGLKRRILFVNGTPTASDSPESMRVARSGDTTVVSFGTSEQYSIPDAFPYGG